jgi:hypothetical protein
MNDIERGDLLAQLAACQERLNAYVDVVADVVERLGHEGSEPSDLLDALGEIEGMLTGKITNEPHDLAGLAEQVRQALWHRDQGRLLLADAHNTCEQRAREHPLRESMHALRQSNGNIEQAAVILRKQGLA